MNTRFVLRATLLAIPTVLVVLALGLYSAYFRFTSLGPTPPPPTILAPRGPLPAGPVGLDEWAQYHREDFAPVGSGFLLRLDDGEIVGVTTAHSVTIGDPARLLERIGLGVSGRPGLIVEADAFHGQPGRARTDYDLTVDYLLLRLDDYSRIDPSLVLTADPRGAPQPGERVSMITGIGGEAEGPSAGRRTLEGSVFSVDERGAWVVMDETVDPGGMSGSPFFSQHTGQVVGMTIAVAPRGGRSTIGLHAIGSILRLAESVTGHVRITEARP